MAKINLNDSGKYQSGGGEYLTLADDGDSVTVRFLYDDPSGEDIDYHLVHMVPIGDAKYGRAVACTGLGEDGRIHEEDCVLCANKFKRSEKLYLQMEDEETQEKYVWERGKNFVGTISTFVNKLGALCEQPITITRNGKKGDNKTTYSLFPEKHDGVQLNELTERSEIIGTVVIDASQDDMLDMIDGVYELGGNRDEKPARRRQATGRAVRDTQQESKVTRSPRASTRSTERASGNDTRGRASQNTERTKTRNSNSAPKPATRRRTTRATSKKEF